MRFGIVLLGALLLAAGVLSYSAIPTIHRTQTITTQDIIQENLSVTGGESRIASKNINITAAQTANLRFDVTVTNTSGSPSLLEVRVFLRNSTDSCIGSDPSAYLIRKVVSSESLSVSIPKTGAYCFIFYNESSTSDKLVSAYARLELWSERVTISRNGSANMAGLGVGAFGFLVLVYGVTRKTVIPWE